MSDYDILLKKKQLRANVKTLKNLMTCDEKDVSASEIWSQIESMPEFKKANDILLYWSLDDEVSTHDFVKKWAVHKRIYLPVINGEELDIVRFKDENNIVEERKFGVGEPTGQRLENLEKITFAIIPGIAFDKMNNRMGRGKAFYDKLLKTLQVFKVGICFKCQYFEDVPTDDNDIKMDKVICG